MGLITLNMNYIKPQEQLINDLNYEKSLNKTKQLEQEKLTKTIEELTTQLNYYKKGKLFKVAKRIYEVKNGKEI